MTITRRNGAALTLSYGSQGELTSISDAHANSIAFTWLYNAGNGTPAGIKAASLPGGYGINYLYSGVAGSTDTVDHDLLTCVQYLDATPTMRDSTSYQYGSANFPYALTAILDSGNVQRWGATYDNITGQAIAESVTGAAGAVEAVFSLLTLNNQRIPPTINHDIPDPAILMDVVPNKARDARVTHAISNSFGFGGQNVSLVMGLEPA